MLTNTKLTLAAAALATGLTTGLTTTTAQAQTWVIGGNGIDIGGCFAWRNGFICFDYNGTRRYLSQSQYNRLAARTR